MKRFPTAYILFALGLLLSASSLHGTVDYIAVNHITREWAFFEDGDLYDPIAWRAIPENSQLHLSLGYSQTSFPYKLEVASVVFAISLFVFWWLRRTGFAKKSP